MNALLLIVVSTLAADITPPAVLDDRLQVQLIAAEPDVVTPTGLAVDDQGRVLVIESHTHFRPEGYKGPMHDRILLMDDFDPATGKARKISVFFEGTTHTMNLAVYYDGSIYVATRAEVFRLRDKDGDGKSDERTQICHLETAGNYPHNGLSGFAFDFAGNVYFGFGENLGADYKLIGSDGKTLAGGGEGGNIYCCEAEGKNLRRVATGFWNPFHLCFDAFGRLFAVDNDPDSRPPCRLLHIVEGGDYGYRFRNGRKGVHPFTAWNGELPGTLPMVAGTGEAPCAVLAYESDNLPEDYRGDLLVTSWGDHQLERYPLKPRGASFSAQMTPVLRGDQNFRPVGLAMAPDGSIFFSDWVDKSYNLHGKGRVWRLSAKNPPERTRPREIAEALLSRHGPWREAGARHLTPDKALEISKTHGSKEVRSVAARRFLESDLAGHQEWMSLLAADAPAKYAEIMSPAYFLNHDARMKALDDQALTPEIKAAALRALLQLPSGRQELHSPDPFLQQAAVRLVTNWMKTRHPRAFENEIVREVNGLIAVSPKWDAEYHQGGPGWAFVVRNFGSDRFVPHVPATMVTGSDDPQVQLIGLEWIAELRDQRLRKEVEWAIAHAKTRQVFEAALATLDILDRGPGSDPKAESAGDAYVARLLADGKAEADVRRFALRSLPPEHPGITSDLLKTLLGDKSESIRLEAIRTIRQRPDADRWPQLREIASGKDHSTQERCEAILGLSPGNDNDRKLLMELAAGDSAEVADEALRALRGFDMNEGEKQKLADLAGKPAGPRKELAERVLARNPPKNLPKPEDHAAWLALAEGEGNAQAGERIFYHLRVGGCFRCHEFEGRGYQIGPDLTNIGRTMTRERLVQSIVDPSREIAPMFTNWSILTTAGESLTGIHVGDEVDGRIKFADQNGRVFHVHPNDIDRRQPSSQSVMPAGLAENLTAQELRDLLAFLIGQPSRLSQP
ncbi:MAG: c-type cytochrome [Planctomycetaceae bacterium]|nr:c-type cytochrome [Planctomycetaceae bacterium]